MTITKITDFKSIKNSHNKFVGRFFIALYDPIEGTEVGFLCSKKTCKRAVDRNFAKRRLKNAFRETFRDFDKHLRILFIARSYSITAEYSKLQKEMEHFKKVLYGQAAIN